VKKLRDGLKEAGEDVQLPVYVALMQDDVAEALYLSLDKDSAETVPLPAEALAESRRAIDRLKEIFSRLREGAPMPAQGVDAVCEWCEMRGLCRRDYWS
jgi:ATP-dependent helicase/nuclease subunit B